MKPPEGRANTADILLIGAQRAMTTWAHRLAALHPDAWVFPDSAPLTSTNKEAQFWTRNRQRGADWYRCLMTPPERRDRLSLDFSPDYALLDAEAIAECKALSPTAKVIYILRDPLARALSALRVHTMWDSGNAAHGTVTLRPGAEVAARAERARLWAHADYAGNVARWRAAYPGLALFNAEDLAADPVAGAQRLMVAMGLDPARMDPARRAQFEGRARERVWVAPTYGATPELMAWLHGATWRARRRAEAETGMVFKEFEAILEAAP